MQQIDMTTKVGALPWQGVGYPKNAFTLHGLNGRTSGIVQGLLAGVGITGVTHQDGPEYEVIVDGASASRLERLMATEHAKS